MRTSYCRISQLPSCRDLKKREAGFGALNRTLRQSCRTALILGLVVNIIVLWNTLYLDAALEQLRRERQASNPEDVARLSPLVFDLQSAGALCFLSTRVGATR